MAKIVEVDATGRTSMPNVWAAGDGAQVAINVLSELNGQRYVDHDVLKTNEYIYE